MNRIKKITAFVLLIIIWQQNAHTASLHMTSYGNIIWVTIEIIIPDPGVNKLPVIKPRPDYVERKGTCGYLECSIDWNLYRSNPNIWKGWPYNMNRMYSYRWIGEMIVGEFSYFYEDLDIYAVDFSSEEPVLDPRSRIANFSYSISSIVGGGNTVTHTFILITEDFMLEIDGKSYKVSSTIRQVYESCAITFTLQRMQ